MHVHTLPNGKSISIGGRFRPTKEKVSKVVRLDDLKLGINYSKWPALKSQTTYSQIASVQPVLSDILGNDTLGDCTEACSYHLQALREGASNRTVFHPSLSQVITTYSRDGGYVPGQPNTDNGCDELTVLQNAKNLGITNGNFPKQIDKLVGYIAVDPTNTELVRRCIQMFVGGVMCLELPDSWYRSFTPGMTWELVNGVYTPNSANGHCVAIVDENNSVLKLNTWGNPAYITYEAFAAACLASNGGSFYIESDWEIMNMASLQSPDALDWAMLREIFDTISAVEQ
jgi:hypothetical protein